MKTLTINQRVFKHQDTQTKLKISLFENDSRVSLDSNYDYQFKIKNSSGYLKSETLTIEDNRLVLTTDKFKDLTPDTYNFEVWVNEDSIYPSDSYGYFKITKNVSEVDGETIPVITIEDFEKRFAEAIKNAKGDKGERGPQGPVGPKGERGADGVDGKSAYQIWLELGNKGTEQDFINSLKAQSERHGPTGYTLDRSTKPWTVWFDNGVGLQFPDFYNNAMVYGYDGTTEDGDGGIPRLLCRVATGECGMPMKQIYNMTDGASLNFFGISKNTKVINPVNTKITNWEELNYSVSAGDPKILPVYLIKIPNTMRVLYGIGIVNDDFIENIDKTMPKEYKFIEDGMGRIS